MLKILQTIFSPQTTVDGASIRSHRQRALIDDGEHEVILQVEAQMRGFVFAFDAEPLQPFARTDPAAEQNLRRVQRSCADQDSALRVDPNDLAVVALCFDTDGGLPIEEHSLRGCMSERVEGWDLVSGLVVKPGCDFPSGDATSVPLHPLVSIDSGGHTCKPVGLRFRLGELRGGPAKALSILKHRLHPRA